MNPIRVFIAFKVSDEAKSELFRIQEELKLVNQESRITWSNPAGFHVTIEFLGEVSADLATQIARILERVAKEYKPFDLRLQKIDSFPNRFTPKAIVVKVEDGGGESKKIHDDLVGALRQIGLGQEDRSWKPHITLARNKGDGFINGLDAVKLKKVVWKVESVELIKSDLLSSGPRYTTLLCCKLGRS